jgi:hypothetical protein
MLLAMVPKVVSFSILFLRCLILHWIVAYCNGIDFDD